MGCTGQSPQYTLTQTWYENSPLKLILQRRKLEDGKGWGHKRGDLKMPFSTWKIPENTLIFESRNFQAFFMAPLPRKMHEKCLKNAWFENQGVFKSPLLCPHPLPSSEKKSVHDHHQKKIFWGTFLASKKNFLGRWWIQKPYENQENHIYHRNLSSVAPTFSAKKSSALKQGGVCFLFPSFAKHFGTGLRIFAIFKYNSLRILIPWEYDSLRMFFVKFAFVIFLNARSGRFPASVFRSCLCLALAPYLCLSEN